MDRGEYRKKIRGHNSNWLRYGNKSLVGLTRSTADIGSKTHPPTCIFNYLRRVKMHTV